MDTTQPKLKAVFLLATLKPKGEFSHTEVLCRLLIENFEKYNVESEVIHLNEYVIKPGIETEVPGGDDWPAILKKVLAADILIFATPIWWGIQSSLMQRVIERMDALNDELLETGKSELANKVGGIVITGAEDGAQHIIGNILNFLSWNGLTIPPAPSLSWLGDPSKDNPETLLQKFRENKSVANMAKVMAHNAVFFARMLKQNPLPQVGEGTLKDIAPGTVGMKN
jgi:multimeric flavodoxin WrbA